MHMIVAMDQRGAIGKGGKLPDWKLKDDMKHFVDTTRNKIVVMGRKNYFSIPEKFRPLPGRRENIVLTRNPELFINGCIVVNRMEHIFCPISNRCLDDIWIIGGGEIYKLFLPHVKHIVVTHVDTVVMGADVFFPEIPKDWESREIRRHEADERNDFSFRIVEYRKNFGLGSTFESSQRILKF